MNSQQSRAQASTLLNSILKTDFLIGVDDGSQTLYDVHQRLKKINSRTDYDGAIFGNVSIIAVGDLFQLQPVKQKYIFELPNDANAQLFGCLWDNFELLELTASMRQKNDLAFPNMLSCVREAKHTNPNPNSHTPAPTHRVQSQCCSISQFLL